MTTKKRVSRARRVVALAVVGASITASADQYENRSASDCVAVSGAVMVRADGGIENAAITPATVVCPIERRWSGASPSLYVSGRVWAVDQNAGEGVCCRVVSVNPSSGVTLESPPVCTAGTSSAAQSITSAEVHDTYSFSHFFLRCEIPAASGSARSRIQTVRNIQR